MFHLSIKRGIKDLRDSYRPLRILPIISELFEKCMSRQMSKFFEDVFFSKKQCGFRIGHITTQYCILKMFEKWNVSVDNGNFFSLYDDDTTNFADDNTPYFYVENLDEIIDFLEQASVSSS